MEMPPPELVVTQDLPPPWSSLATVAVVEQQAHLQGSHSKPSSSPLPTGSDDRRGAPKLQVVAPELVVAQDLPPPWSSLAALAVLEQHAHLQGSRSKPSSSPSLAGFGDQREAPELQAAVFGQRGMGSRRPPGTSAAWCSTHGSNDLLVGCLLLKSPLGGRG
ncbi:hypothetical protein E2562_038695 [Oryza meyeriana var. granulata]|uniref:Uncharacterized protein n=1 Tax=Oryza meyeriana var. granulata TaxID=110450 RepID=A0A6G1CXR4_9ORYZ|nr:hypothetical protein E2562_038695 [Oryza meyeriana var. granulata]